MVLAYSLNLTNASIDIKALGSIGSSVKSVVEWACCMVPILFPGRHWILGGESMRAPPKLILARLIFFAIADFNKKREKSKSII